MDGKKNYEPDKFEGMSIFRPPLCRELTGKSFTLDLDDGYIRKLELIDAQTLRFGKAEGERRTYSYECLKAEEQTYFINFEEEHVFPRAAYSIVLDLEQSLVTMAVSHLGQDPKYPRMPSIDFVLGGIMGDKGEAPAIRHGYTPDLVGRAITWSYGTFDVIHVYSSER